MKTIPKSDARQTTVRISQLRGSNMIQCKGTLRIALGFFLISGVTAQEPVSLYQEAPPDWRAEVIPFPLSFAPEIPLKGIEELRFAPDMLQPSSETYFTYTFLWWLDGEQPITAADLERHLLVYYQGLYRAVSKTQDHDASGFTVEVQPTSQDEKAAHQFVGLINWADPFVTEQELELHLRISHWFCPQEKKTAVFFAVSPKFPGHANWTIMANQRAGNCENGNDP